MIFRAKKSVLRWWILGLVSMAFISITQAQTKQPGDPSITIYVNDSDQKRGFDQYFNPFLEIPKFHLVEIFSVSEIETRLSDGLPGSEAEAQAMALQRVRQAEAELEYAWQQALRLHHLNITHVPAIVFNNEAVWYGNRLDLAWEAWRAWKKQFEGVQ